MCTFGAIAEPSTTQPQKPKGKSGGAVLHTVYKSHIDKRAPSRIQIGIEYSDGQIVMYSENEEECLSLEISNCNSGEAIVIPDIYSGESREVDLNCGQYNLTATNTEGTSYAGMMEVDYY